MKLTKLFSKKKKPDEVLGRCSFVVDVGDNRVDVRMYDSLGYKVASAYGYIIHEGDFGVAQAASYATMKIAKNMNGGRF